MEKYYWLDTPSKWEVILQDNFTYFLKPINRQSTIIDKANKNANYICNTDIPAFDTKEELINFNNKRIEYLIEQKRKEFESYKEKLENRKIEVKNPNKFSLHDLTSWLWQSLNYYNKAKSNGYEIYRNIY